MNRDPSRLGDKIIFWTCIVALLGIYTDMVFEIGKDVGLEKCRPTVLIPKVMSYPKTKKEMAMFLKTREAAGGVR
jgi:hypothetical protein